MIPDLGAWVRRAHIDRGTRLVLTLEETDGEVRIIAERSREDVCGINRESWPVTSPHWPIHILRLLTREKRASQER